MWDPHAVDLAWWGDVVVKAGAMTAALYGLWRVWLRPIVQWFQLQGLLHVQVAQIVITELPKISLTLGEHEARLTDVERALRGAAIIPEPPIPLTPRYRREDI